MRSMACSLFALSACGAPAAPPPTGGSDLEAGRCGRGLTVVQSDYQSTNVSLLSLEGEVLSSSFISSASAAPGLSAALSGDVVAPSSIADGEDLVIIDRYPASVLTFVDIANAEVHAQLDVGTGFAANPQDYLLIDAHKAYVSRFETNMSPGSEAHDAGGDVLLVDPTAAAIVGRIDLAPAVTDAAGFLPRANRMLRDGDRVFVLLSAYDATFSDSAFSRIATIDARDDGIVDVTLLDGLEGCSAMTISGDELAVACSGAFADGAATNEGAGVALLSIDGALSVKETWLAADLGLQPIGFSVAIEPSGALLFPTLGAFGEGGMPDQSDALVELSRDGTSREIARSEALPFSFGEVRCLDAVADSADERGCGVCWLCDAESSRLWRIEMGSVVDGLVVHDQIGLPPRTLGRF